jgi:hypothetical protein
MAYDIGEAFQRIEEEMIASMSRNLKRHLKTEQEEGLNYTMWQAEQLAALHNYKKDNKKKFASYFSTINGEIEELIRKANETGLMEQEVAVLEAIKKGYKTYNRVGSKTIRGEFFKINERKLNALIKATKHDMAKGETAMLRRANDEYRKIIYNAEVYYNTGVGTLAQSVDMATKDFLARGISCIEYTNGARVGIDSYARMALRTAQTRAYLLGEATKRDEWGVNTVIVNKRGVACPLCLKYCGQVFYDDVWGNSPIPSPAKYPLLSEAIAGGLYHPNCKDIHTTYFEGISTPPEPMTKAEKDEASRVYNLEQQQRYNERQIRKYKRLSDGSVDPENRDRYYKKLSEWQEAQKKFVKAHGDVLKRRYENEKIHGIGPIDNADTRRTVAQMKREVALEKLQKTVDKSEKSGIMKTDTFKKIKGKHTIADDIGTPSVPMCNPKHNTKGMDYKNNCGYCSATYEMRRRGYDVIANPKKDGLLVADWQKLFKDSKPIQLISQRTDALATELRDKLSALGDGARGSIFVEWKNTNGWGHFFSWEVENGIVRFIDGQSGEVDVGRYIGMSKPSKTVCLRWDDLEPSDMIKEACKNRGGE